MNPHNLPVLTSLSAEVALGRVITSLSMTLPFPLFTRLFLLSVINNIHKLFICRHLYSLPLQSVITYHSRLKAIMTFEHWDSVKWGLVRESVCVFYIYIPQQTSAKTRWVSYIVVHYWLHPSCRSELLGSFRIRCGWWRWSSWVFCGLAGYSGDVLELEHVSKFLLNVIRVGWRFGNLSL